MRKTATLLLLLLLAAGAHAQTAREWLQQKKTQQAYLLEQLAALRLYADIARQGYDITQEGLRAIGSENSAEYGSHLDFFRSLRQADSDLSSYWKLADALVLGDGVVRLCRHARRLAQDREVFRAEEAVYMERVTQRLLTESGQLLEDLRALAASDHWVMDTAGRLRLVEATHRLLLEHFQVARAFEEEVRVLASIRQREREAGGRHRELHGLAPGRR